MMIRNMSPCGKKICAGAVAQLAAFQGRSPKELTIEDVRVSGGLSDL